MLHSIGTWSYLSAIKVVAGLMSILTSVGVKGCRFVLKEHWP